MRPSCTILPLLMLAAGVAAAQAPPTVPSPQPAYGRYAIPQPVPYQPTLAPPAAAPTGPAGTLAAPVVITPIARPQPPPLLLPNASGHNIRPRASLPAACQAPPRRAT